MNNFFKNHHGKKLMSIGLALGLGMMSTTANAVRFDFQAIADNQGAITIGSTELEWRETTFSSGLQIGGITLVASGTNANNTLADAFFDKGNAGLGVCSTPQTGGSGPNSGCRSGGGTNVADDNVSGAQGGETLKLSFDKNVRLDDILFRNSGHGLATGSLFINGSLLNIASGILNATDLASLAVSAVFDFAYNTAQGGTEFYIDFAEVSVGPQGTINPVPLPAALPLYGTGLAVMGFLGWRRKRKAVA